MNPRGIATATTLVTLALATGRTEGQTPLSEHTLRLDRSTPVPEATVGDLDWLAGHWLGEGLGGVSEEMWSPPRAGQMMGVYRLVVGDETRLFEIFTLLEVDGRVVLRLKHFHANLHAWEEPAETVDFPLVRLDGRTAYFHGLTFDRTVRDELRIWLVLSEEGGVPVEEAFHLRRVTPAGGG